jgi:hypothetical protein
MPYTDEELRKIVNRGEALNAYMSTSSIPEAAQAAQLRQRQQEAYNMQTRNLSADQRALAARGALSQSEGRLDRAADRADKSPYFQGTGMEAQAANQYVAEQVRQGRDPQVVMAELSKQRLTQPRTITTPQGTTTIEGYNLDGSAPRVTPKVASGDEKRANLAVSQIATANPDMVKPGIIEDLATENLPPSIASWFTGDEYATDLVKQNQLLANTIYLQSGAAAGQDEINSRRKQYFPSSGDSDKVKASKKANLAKFVVQAQEAFSARTGAPSPDVIDPRVTRAANQDDEYEYQMVNGKRMRRRK